MTGWIEIGKIEDIPRQGARVVRTVDGDIAVFRTNDGKIFALRDSCPHKQGPLSQGIVHGDRVTCPLHNWVFELKTGEAIAPDKGCAQVVAVKVRDGAVHLLPTPEVVAEKTGEVA